MLLCTVVKNLILGKHVAISRVKSEENLQVIGFQKRYLLAPPQEIAQIQDGNPVETFKCCMKVESDQENYKLGYYDRDWFEMVL